MRRTGAIRSCVLLLAMLACMNSCNWFSGFRSKHSPADTATADTVAVISPYDSLIRVWADTLQWDWKLLAALIHKESRFNAGAVSRAGAQGLMQLRPRTAIHFGCEDPMDPEQNIRAGVKLLQALRGHYKSLAADEKELTKFTLAAYNAGSGHLQDCINHASYLGLDPSYWHNIESVIPLMKEDSVVALDHVKNGAFYGHETISFVRQVLATQKRYNQR